MTPSCSPPRSKLWMRRPSSCRKRVAASRASVLVAVTCFSSHGIISRYRARVSSTEVPGNSASATESRMDPMPSSSTVFSSLNSSTTLIMAWRCLSSWSTQPSRETTDPSPSPSVDASRDVIT